MLLPLIAVMGCTVVEAIVRAGGPPGDPGPEGWGPPDTGTEGVDGAPGAGFPFDAPGKVFELALDIPATSIDQLERNGPMVPATFRFAGYAVEVGIRFKGSSTYDDLDGKPSFKIDFAEYAPDARFLGLERLTLNSMKFDPTMLREATAYRLFEHLGVPAPRHGFATLTINGAPYGVYSLVETLDENFLKRGFPGDDDGYLYDSTFVSADLTSFGKANFQLQEGDLATAFVDLDALVDALNGGNILEVLESRFLTDETLTFLAADLVTSNWDGYSRNTNNYLVYHATVADRWAFVPWGQDTAFRGGGSLYMGVRGRVTTECQGDAACRARLEDACRHVLATWEDNDLYGYAEGLGEAIAPACAADPRKDGECEIEDHLEKMAQRMEDMRLELGM